jgi:hypothetical protein
MIRRGAIAVRATIVACGLGAVLVFACSHARAADIPVKAPAAQSFLSGYPYVGSGFYWGLNSFAAVGSATASAPGLNPNSITTNQGAIGLTLGYTWSSPNVFYAVEGMFDFTNLNGSAPGLSLNGPAALELRVKAGTPLSNVLAMLPSLGLPTVNPFPALSGTAVATNVHNYLMAGLHADATGLDVGVASNKQWQFSPSVGMGMMGQLTNAVAVDTWVEAIFASKSTCVGALAALCVKQGTKYQAGIAVLY